MKECEHTSMVEGCGCCEHYAAEPKACGKCGREDCYQEACSASRYEFPITHDLVIASLYATLARIDRNMDALYDDPMSYGAPLEDFHEAADRRRRKILGEIARRAKIVNDTAAKQFAASTCGEAWMP